MTVQNAGTFLTRILDHKRIEVERQSAKLPLERLEAMIAAAPPTRPFGAALCHPDRAALIAEVKKASPSKGVLIENFDPIALAQTYAANGASAISVLTDVRFFQGSVKYLQGIRLALDTQDARRATRDARRETRDARRETRANEAQSPVSSLRSPVSCPLLRKDFIIAPYQVYEARAYGADALLLIVAALEDALLAQLLRLTHELGMQALVEVHDESELDRALAAGAQIVGVNNRNLHTFVTSLETTRQVAARLPARNRPLLVSESGIFTPAHVAQIREWGADAILVGEALATAPDTAARVRELAGLTA